MDELSPKQSAPVPAPVGEKGPPISIDKAIANVFTHWQTSSVGAALLGLGVASYFGVPLPADLHLTGSQLIVDGLVAMGFLAAKDAAK